MEEARRSLAATGRVDEDYCVAGHRVQRVGPAQVSGRPEVVAGHRQPHRVDIAAHHPGRAAAQRRDLGANRARHIVHNAAGQPLRPMRRHNRGAGLLQRLVGEQPRAGTGQLVRRAPPQLRIVS